tara:strand:- start:382 stop:489 length:108 start_codon:yes stop_codon:yes gene_type:complete
LSKGDFIGAAINEELNRNREINIIKIFFIKLKYRF